MASSFFIILQKLYNELNAKGFDFINERMPRCHPNADVLSERVKAVCLTICAFSTVVMVIYPQGWLYASLPRPFYVALLYMLNFNLPLPPTPEWGIHYITLVMYFISMYYCIEYFEAQGIDKPFHKLAYSFSLMIISFFFPFEVIYVTLYDLFHNLPMYGAMLTWCVTIKPESLLWYIMHSVMTFDFVLLTATAVIMYILYKDMSETYKLKIQFNKTSKLLLLGFILSYAFWICIPLIQPNVQGWGTNWFPQTIYVHFGFFKDYNVTYYNTWGLDYGIVSEHWYPNDLVRYANHITKLFSVAFMFYTFTPRRVEYNEENKRQ